ncbi:MAG: DsbC family protein [Lautropia sp.]
MIRCITVAGALAAAKRAAVLAGTVVALLALLPAAPATAQVDPSIAIRSSVEAWLQGRYKIEEISPTPMPNIYEVRIGTDLMYVDARGQFAFVEGQLIDLRANRNLTQARIEDLQRIDFKRDLPLADAIKQVNGSGKRVVAVFEDPNCTYCRKLRADLMKVKDLTLYTFAYPILAPDSDVKSRKAWCAKDRGAAWNELMTGNRVPDNDGSCDNPVARNRALGQKLSVTGTPTLFFPNGKRVPGAIPVQQLEKLLAENS